MIIKIIKNPISPQIRSCGWKGRGNDNTTAEAQAHALHNPALRLVLFIIPTP